ncbi:MAG: hypothetical protein QGG64_20290 [Candidatus Latescibacteria bacterium]|nr:hypothetical protein [Candidatus Latescibacterota bacterium]
MSRISKYLLFVVGFIASLSAAASANIVIDLDSKEGDQNVREAQVKPGEIINLELVAQSGAQDIEGFEVQMHFDPNNFAFRGFQPGGLMTGAIALPPQKTSDGVKLSVGFLGRKSPGDAGSLGKMQIQVTKNFSGTGKISLVEGSYGAKGQTQKFPLNTGVLLTTGATKDAGGTPTQQPPTDPVKPGTALDDPNEPAIADGKDFQKLEIGFENDAVQVRISTYGKWSMRPFQSLYFAGGEHGQVHVKLNRGRFVALGESPRRRGSFNVKLFEGRSHLDGNTYALEFLWSAVFGKTDRVEAWVFSQDGRDRLPDGRGRFPIARDPQMATQHPNQGGGFQPPGQQNQPPGQQPGFQPPGQQNQPQGQPTAQQMAQMFRKWMQSPERADMNKDGRVNAEDFKIWYDQKNNPGGQNPPGQNNPPGGFQNPPGPNNPPQGQGRGRGGSQGQDKFPKGEWYPPQGQGYPGGPGSGPMGGPGEHGMPGEHGPNPEELISKLPQALQGTFKETWKFSERAHMEAELKSQEHILKTLSETKKYVTKASEEEKKQIAQVLMAFHMGGGEQGGPGGPGMPGEHGGPMGLPQDADINDVIDQMIKDVTRDMEEIKKMLSTM